MKESRTVVLEQMISQMVKRKIGTSAHIVDKICV